MGISREDKRNGIIQFLLNKYNVRFLNVKDDTVEHYRESHSFLEFGFIEDIEKQNKSDGYLLNFYVNLEGEFCCKLSRYYMTIYPSMYVECGIDALIMGNNFDVFIEKLDAYIVKNNLKHFWKNKESK